MTATERPATERFVDPPSESVGRLPGPDVVRAVALIGVVVMNYHGYLVFEGGGAFPDSTVAERFFHPHRGPLSTRFAATFVLMAGVGITLLTRRVVARGTRVEINGMRWRLVRRGLALYVLGQVLEVIWNGTIIIFYGAMFVVAALLFTLATRWLVAVGLAATLASWWLATWSFWQVEDGGSVSWLTQPGQDSIRRIVFEVTINGTHPLVPWLAFLCAGIVVGRHLDAPDWRLRAGGLGFVLYAAATIASQMGTTPFRAHLLSPHPFDRGAVYVASALGTSLIALAVISWLAERAAGAAPVLVEPFRQAGQMTLTLYVAHILVFNLLVDWLDVVQPNGLGTALTFALCFWVVAIALGAAWFRRFGRGPAERVYRAIGG